MNNSFTKLIFNTKYYEFNHQNLFEPFVAQSSKSLLLLIKNVFEETEAAVYIKTTYYC